MNGKDSTSKHPIHSGGRPTKFKEPSRPVTTTLPERTLALLSTIDEDRAAAIVKVVDAHVAATATHRPPVDEIVASHGQSMIVVSENRLLRTIPWLSMLEVAPGRFLLSMTSGVSIEKLELTLVDLIDSHHEDAPEDCEKLGILLKQLRAPRRNKAVVKEEILLIHKK